MTDTGTEPQASVADEAAFDELSQQAYEAREAGNADEAQKFFDERDQLADRVYDGVQEQAGDEGWPDEIEVELPDEATVEGIQEMLEQQPGGPELIAEWGADFEDNVGHTKLAYEWIAGQYDDGIEFLDQLEPTPALIELGARLGRMLAHYNPLDVPTIPNRKEPPPMAQKRQPAEPALSFDEQMDALTLQAHEAQAAGDRDKASKLFNRRDQLAERHFTEPVVGQNQRTV